MLVKAFEIELPKDIRNMMINNHAGNVATVNEFERGLAAEIESDFYTITEHCGISHPGIGSLELIAAKVETWRGVAVYYVDFFPDTYVIENGGDLYSGKIGTSDLDDNSYEHYSDSIEFMANMFSGRFESFYNYFRNGGNTYAGYLESNY